ncbi:hypothetical protein [Gemmobacter aquaticus]|jgi:hypothetical protein|nr:hypothetical protein [Gemmobacter aquaticus]
MPYEEFENLLRRLLHAIEIDEEWYRRAYPDVDQAIRDGAVKSARDHFLNSGYFEGRLPSEVKVDEAWYLATYPDIAEAVRAGSVPSARQHFLSFGYAEGRLPSP